MQLIRGLHNLAKQKALFEQGCVLTIGNFDGVHLGHQQVLNEVHAQAQCKNIPSVVMVFEPLPIEFFAPENAPVRLMNLREKMQAFAQTQIDYVLCVHFDQAFAELTADAFVKQILVDSLNIKHVVVGDDFRFGQQRKGNFEFLQTAGLAHGFSVADMPTFCIAEERVSSTRIREDLEVKNLDGARELLGKPFSFNGRVIHGQKLGRTIGFPTLNMNPKRIQMPLTGVYAVTVEGAVESQLFGVANLGLRPTVNGVRPSIEVHLFDVNLDLYGKHLDIVIEKFIRPEQKFSGIDALKEQIAKDAQQAREFFGIASDKT